MSITEELREYASSLAMKAGASTTEVKGALEEIADRINEALKSYYIPLPKDADGVPIRVYDRVVDWDTPRIVVAVSADSICLAGYEFDSYYRMGVAMNYRHYHEPTVEDVLEKFVERWMETHHDDIPALKAEYAAKLRLAGEDE